MTELLAHAGHAHGESLAVWQLAIIAVLYLSLAAGVGVGILIGKRNQRATTSEPGYRSPAWNGGGANGDRVSSS